PRSDQDLTFPEKMSATCCAVTSFVWFERLTITAIPSQPICVAFNPGSSFPVTAMCAWPDLTISIGLELSSHRMSRYARGLAFSNVRANCSIIGISGPFPAMTSEPEGPSPATCNGTTTHVTTKPRAMRTLSIITPPLRRQAWDSTPPLEKGNYELARNVLNRHTRRSPNG